MSKHIKIFDTTLRDGEQAPSCSMNIDEKLEIAKQLELLKVDVIEAGFAVSSPGDFSSVKIIAETIKDCQVASLARATEKDIDAAYEAIKNATAPRIHLFLATSPVHMQYKLKMTPEQVLERTSKMVSYAKKYCADIEFSAEDAMRSQPEFLAQVTAAAISAGAVVVNIPDTVGFVTPEEMYDRITYLFKTVPNIDKAELSLHCHNDLGMAVANSLAGIRAGATQVECTVNGLGERAGNAALEEIVMALHTRKTLFDCHTNINTKQIYRTSKLVYNTIGQVVSINKPIVGTNAFLHESGIHQHGVLAEKSTYEIMTPESIGINKTNMILGKHSGRHAFADRIKKLGYTLNEQEINKHFETFKDICDKKKSVCDSDIEAIISNKELEHSAYKLVAFDVHSHSGKHSRATCLITLQNGEQKFEEVSLGDGPIDAAYNAIDKIVKLEDNELEDYSIHSVSDGKDALGEVMVKLRAGNIRATGRGLSPDIIESSILAYINGVNKILNMGWDKPC